MIWSPNGGRGDTVKLDNLKGLDNLNDLDHLKDLDHLNHYMSGVCIPIVTCVMGRSRLLLLALVLQ